MTERKCLAAYTACEDSPPYLNISREGDTAIITVRGEPKKINGVYVCGYAPQDTNTPGRCTPGDDHCNNYCNMAPQKGPMADAPLHCNYKALGDVVSIRIPIDAFTKLIQECQTDHAEKDDAQHSLKL